MRRKPRRDRGELDDKRYLDFIRRQRCCACGALPISHAHHVTGAGMALKAADRDAIPLCARCHADLHEFRHAFHVSREVREAWQRKQVDEHRALYARVGA
jgi:hypothetical protein